MLVLLSFIATILYSITSYAVTNVYSLDSLDTAQYVQYVDDAIVMPVVSNCRYPVSYQYADYSSGASVTETVTPDDDEAYISTNAALEYLADIQTYTATARTGYTSTNYYYPYVYTYTTTFTPIVTLFDTNRSDVGNAFRIDFTVDSNGADDVFYDEYVSGERKLIVSLYNSSFTETYRLLLKMDIDNSTSDCMKFYFISDGSIPSGGTNAISLYQLLQNSFAVVRTATSFSNVASSSVYDGLFYSEDSDGNFINRDSYIMTTEFSDDTTLSLTTTITPYTNHGSSVSNDAVVNIGIAGTSGGSSSGGTTDMTATNDILRNIYNILSGSANLDISEGHSIYELIYRGFIVFCEYLDNFESHWTTFWSAYYPLQDLADNFYWRYYNSDTGEYEETNLANVLSQISFYLADFDRNFSKAFSMWASGTSAPKYTYYLDKYGSSLYSYTTSSWNVFMSGISECIGDISYGLRYLRSNVSSILTEVKSIAASIVGTENSELSEKIDGVKQGVTDLSDAQSGLESTTSTLEEFDFDAGALGAFSAMAWCSAYLQSMYEGLGAYGTVILIGLMLGLCLQLIGYLRYKT